MENPQKSLESARQRFSQLVSTLTAFNDVLCRGPPDSLPPWSTLQSQFNVISASLASVSSSLSQHFPPSHTNPAALVSYPLPSFPAQTQSILLNMLCNKKPSVAVHDWFVKALNAESPSPSPSPSPSDTAAQDELWRAAIDIVSDLQDSRVWYDVLYTLEERDGGIPPSGGSLLLDHRPDNRKEEKEKVSGGLKLEAMLRFMGTGVMPKDQPPLPTVAQGAGMKR